MSRSVSITLVIGTALINATCSTVCRSSFRVISETGSGPLYSACCGTLASFWLCTELGLRCGLMFFSDLSLDMRQGYGCQIVYRWQ